MEVSEVSLLISSLFQSRFFLTFLQTSWVRGKMSPRFRGQGEDCSTTEGRKRCLSVRKNLSVFHGVASEHHSCSHRAVLENLNTGSPVKMCFIKKLRPILVQKFCSYTSNLFLPKLCEILFDVNRRWRICSNKRCVSSLWGYQLWLQRLLQTRNARAHLSCSGKRLGAAVRSLGNSLFIVPDTKPGKGCAPTAPWVRLKASKLTTPTPQWIICPGI